MKAARSRTTASRRLRSIGTYSAHPRASGNPGPRTVKELGPRFRDAFAGTSGKMKEERRMSEAVIVSTARTPIGKAFRGAFNVTHGATLGGHVIKHAVERAGIEPGEVEDVMLGCATPEKATGSNIARLSAIRAGLPDTVSGVTVNRFCSSGLQTIAMAAQRIIA